MSDFDQLLDEYADAIRGDERGGNKYDREAVKEARAAVLAYISDTRNELNEAGETMAIMQDAIEVWEGHGCGGDCLAAPCGSCDGTGYVPGKGARLKDELEEERQEHQATLRLAAEAREAHDALERELVVENNANKAWESEFKRLRDYAELATELLTQAASVLDYWHKYQTSVTSDRVRDLLLPAIRSALAKNPAVYGVDMGKPGGDKSVEVKGTRLADGSIRIDEVNEISTPSLMRDVLATCVSHLELLRDGGGIEWAANSTEHIISVGKAALGTPRTSTHKEGA